MKHAKDNFDRKQFYADLIPSPSSLRKAGVGASYAPYKCRELQVLPESRIRIASINAIYIYIPHALSLLAPRDIQVIIAV